MTKRIWVISELYYPEDAATGYYLTKISEGLTRYYSVHVLCSQPTYSERGLSAPAREQHNGVSIQRCRGTTLNKDVLILRFVNLVTISMSIFVNAWLRIGKHDVVLVVTNPPLLPFLVSLVCQLRGAKCLLLIHDVYPEVLIAAGMVQESSVLARIGDWLSRKLYQSVARIIVLGRDMAHLVGRKVAGTSSRTVIITNWADLDLVAPGNRRENVLLSELGLSDRFVIQYAGNMGRTHGLEILAEVAQRLDSSNNIHFLFIGSGGKRRQLELAIKHNELSNSTLLKPFSRDDLTVVLDACDIAIISFVPGMAGVSVPSRLYNIMASGKPIVAVADADSELALVVREEQIGWVVPPNDVDGIVAAILEAQTNPAWLAEMGHRARQAAETHYSFEGVIESYHNLVQSLEDACSAQA
jgi:colanic acid biosynthesis glycosyl transferase WcaI